MARIAGAEVSVKPTLPHADACCSDAASLLLDDQLHHHVINVLVHESEAIDC